MLRKVKGLKEELYGKFSVVQPVPQGHGNGVVICCQETFPVRPTQVTNFLSSSFFYLVLFMHIIFLIRTFYKNIKNGIRMVPYIPTPSFYETFITKLNDTLKHFSAVIALHHSIET